MLPQGNDTLQHGFLWGALPTRTYRLNTNGDSISGYTDGLDAVKQAVFLILSVERYQYPIYSWDYGVELAGLFGKPIGYVQPELERRIQEALLQDDRIHKVDNFTFTKERGKICASFTVHTAFGDLQAQKEVEI